VAEFMPTPEARDQYFVDLLTEEWLGRSVDELVATWGTAKKTADHRDGSQSLLYKRQFVEGFQLTPAHYVALSGFGPSLTAGVYFAIPGQLVPRIMGRLKVRFHVDPNGEIVDVEVLALKWTKGKKRHRDDEVVEEPAEPGRPFKTDVEVPRPS
jgi:hypothetical protein